MIKERRTPDDYCCRPHLVLLLVTVQCFCKISRRAVSSLQGDWCYSKATSDKGKPGENRGRKAMGLTSRNCDHDCQAAEDHKVAFVLIRPGLT
jgi:hypothetical protein